MVLGAAAGYVGLGLLSIFVLVGVAVAVALTIVWIGLPLLALSLAALRKTSAGYRRLAAGITGIAVPAPYRPVESIRFVDRIRDRITDPATYRDILWLPVAMSLGLALGLATLVFYIVFPLGVWVCPSLIQLFASLSSTVLERSDPENMRARIGQLARSRTDAVEDQATEIRRIERDLHDGAQARLVALSMNLGLAEQLLLKDPEASRELLVESRQSATTALQDLRRLVRGIHPPVLADRGLVGAVQALALAHPIELSLDLELDGRPALPVESAAYFAVSEILTNSAKHSQAGYGWIWMRHENGYLRVTVGDDGIGGAVITPEGGLRGIERRLEAFDGTLSVTSLPGGPTIVSLELPCALSLEKISRS